MRIDVTGAHFSDVNPSLYDNLNNMKLDLNVSTKAKFSENDKGLYFKNQVNYRFFNYRLDETFW